MPMTSEPATVRTGQYARLRICPRARGLCVDVNLNLDCHCNFDCIYCNVSRHRLRSCDPLNVSAMAGELTQLLDEIALGDDQELAQLRQVAISGDGEPTLCPQFAEALEGVLHVRALHRYPFFKIVILTNATGLDRPEVERALQLLTLRDEIWVKLDAGGQEWMNLVNRPGADLLERVAANILRLARRRPVVVQTLFPSVRGHGPTEQEIERYVQQLRRLINDGAQIASVQIYSASPPTADPTCGHLPLRTLSGIARIVRNSTGLSAEVF